MSELYFLNNIPKEYTKELNFYKFILTILTEIKQEANYIKLSNELEVKSIEQFGKNTVNLSKMFIQEINLQTLMNEDASNLCKIMQFIINHLENISKHLEDFSQNIYINKLFNDVIEETAENFKNLQEGVSNAFKELLNFKVKYKACLIKYEKSYKELDTNINNKRKLENDEKNSYNLSMKDKVDDKILNYLNEFEDNRQSLINLYDEYKKSEENINNINKNALVNNIKYDYGIIVKFVNCYKYLIENKNNCLLKIKDQISKSISGVSNIEIEISYVEKKYSEIKGIKYGIILL